MQLFGTGTGNGCLGDYHIPLSESETDRTAPNLWINLKISLLDWMGQSGRLKNVSHSQLTVLYFGQK